MAVATSRPRILVVDDDEPLRVMVSRMLKAAGYEVRQSSDGAEVTDALRRESIDLILSDISMPRRGGIETLIDIRKEHPLLPVVFMTGAFPTDSGPLFDLAHAFGVRHLMQKPFTERDLLSAVADGLSDGRPEAPRRSTEIDPGVFLLTPRPWLAEQGALMLTSSDFAAYVVGDPISAGELAAGLQGSVLLIDIDDERYSWPETIRDLATRRSLRIGVVSNNPQSDEYVTLQQDGMLELGYVRLSGDADRDLATLRELVRTAEVPRRSRGLQVVCADTQAVLACGHTSCHAMVTEISLHGFTCLVESPADLTPGSELSHVSLDLGSEDLACSGVVGRVRIGSPATISVNFDRPLSQHEQDLVRRFMLTRLQDGVERRADAVRWRRSAVVALQRPLRRLQWALLTTLVAFLGLLAYLIV